MELNQSSYRGAQRRQAESRSDWPIFSPRPTFPLKINSLQQRQLARRLFVGLGCGSFVGTFSGPAFALLKYAKQLSHLSKPLSEYGSRCDKKLQEHLV